MSDEERADGTIALAAGSVGFGKATVTGVKPGIASLGPHTAVEHFMAVNAGDTENTLSSPPVRLENAGGNARPGSRLPLALSRPVSSQQVSDSNHIDIGIRSVNHGSAPVMRSRA
jgi:hypothetical protein